MSTVYVPREANRALPPIPPGHQAAFHALGNALGVKIPRPAAAEPAVAWLGWQVVARQHGWHVARQSACGSQHEFVRNAVGKVTVFRSLARAQAAVAGLEGGAA